MEDKSLDFPNNDLEHKVARLSALYDISSALNSIIDRDELLRLIMRKTKELLDVEGTSIIFWDSKKRMFYFPLVVEDTKEIEKSLKQLSFPDDSGIAGWVFHEGRPALVNNVDQDPRFYKQIDKNTKCKTNC